MKLLKISGLMVLLSLLGNIHAAPVSATTPSTLIAEALDCHHLAQLTYTEMNSAQIQIAKSCDQHEAAQGWLNIYGKMNHTELAKAMVYEVS
ncbi:hypothetical protein [Snodgrassella alvi]|nr:hypothetical protein [Snodgrassella alvi]